MKRSMWFSQARAVLITGVAFYHSKMIPNSNDGEAVLITNGIEETTSLKALEAMVGFDVEELTNLPFDISENSYVSYDGEIAEVNYYGDEQSLSFRKSAGEGDNSGDYEEYGNESEITVNGIDVLLRGSDAVSALYAGR